MKIFICIAFYGGLWCNLPPLQATSPRLHPEELITESSPKPTGVITSITLVQRAQASSIVQFLAGKGIKSEIEQTSLEEEKQAIATPYATDVTNSLKTKKSSLLQRLNNKIIGKEEKNKKGKKKSRHKQKLHSAELNELEEPGDLTIKAPPQSQKLKEIDGMIVPVQEVTGDSPSPTQAGNFMQEGFNFPFQKPSRKWHPLFRSKCAVTESPDPKRNIHTLSRRAHPKGEELEENEGKIVPVEVKSKPIETKSNPTKST